jgi:hypothetical protein
MLPICKCLYVFKFSAQNLKSLVRINSCPTFCKLSLSSMESISKSLFDHALKCLSLSFLQLERIKKWPKKPSQIWHTRISYFFSAIHSTFVMIMIVGTWLKLGIILKLNILYIVSIGRMNYVSLFFPQLIPRNSSTNKYNKYN